MWIKHNRRLLAKVLLLLVILVIGGVTVSGCYGRSQPRGWSGAIIAGDALFVGSIDGSLVALNKSDGSRLWTSESEIESEIVIYGTPAVEGDLVYVGGYDGKVYAFDAGSGAWRWDRPRKELGPIVGGVAVSEGKVYFGGCDKKLEFWKVYALDATTGDTDTAWQPFETGDKIWSTPVIDGETIYISSFDKKLYALDTIDGSKKWEFETGGAIASTPLVYDNTVYIGSFDRYLYAVDATDGSLRWRSEVEAGKWFWAKPVVYNNVIYAPNLDGKVYILDAESGREVASAVDLGSPISSDPVVVDGKVIIASEEGKIYSLDTSNNQAGLLRSVGDDGQGIYAPLSASDGVVYIHAQSSKEDTLYALNTETGVTLWSLSLSSK